MSYDGRSHELNALTFTIACFSFATILFSGGLLMRLPPGPTSALTILAATLLTAVLTQMMAIAHRVDRLSRDV